MALANNCPQCDTVSTCLGGSTRGRYAYACQNANCAFRWTELRLALQLNGREVRLSNVAVGGEPRRSGGYTCRTCGQPKIGHTCSGPTERIFHTRFFHTRFDHVLKRMDPNVKVPRYTRRADDLPSRTEALGRVFRAALWAVRMKPTRERRIAAIAAMRDLPIDVKVHILGMANLYRNTPPHPRIKWPLRYAEQRERRASTIAWFFE
jgi:hypothetical protein